MIPTGPKGLPFLGNAQQFRRDPFGLFLRAAREHGPVARLTLGPLVYYLLSKPEHVEHVLVGNAKNYPKSVIFQRFKVLLGEGLLTSEGDLWMRQRRLAQPSFKKDALNVFADTIASVVDEHMAHLRPKAERGDVVDFDSEMMTMAFVLIGRTIFGMDFAEDAKRLTPIIGTALRETHLRIHAVKPLPMWLPTPANRRLASSIEAIDRLVYDVIEKRRQKPQRDLLSALLAARDPQTGEGMSDQQLRDEVITLILAGHETTGCSLSWIFYLLGEAPEIERMAAEEALDAKGASALDLAKLPLASRIVQESMRLYPPAWSFSRQAAADDRIGPYTITKGTQIFMSPWVTHRDPALWENPDRFDPSRFEPSRSQGRHKFAYYPFGGGQHLCIGNHLALLELGVALPRILQSYKVELAPSANVVPEAAITLRPHGLRVHLRPRRPT